MGNSLEHTSGQVGLQVSGGVARIVIDRPEKRNALGLATMAELRRIIDRIDAEKGIRVAVLTGAGDRVFASGADLDELPASFESPDSARAYDAEITELYCALLNCTKPVIARMAGHAIGGGLLLALACDMRIAASHIRVALPTALIGLMLSPVEHQLILRQMSLSSAKRMMFTGTRLLADEAKALGLVDVVASPEMLDATVDEVSNRIANGAPRAISMAKAMLDATDSGVNLQEVTSRAYQSIYTSKDLKEGLTAIRSKRKPRFTGE